MYVATKEARKYSCNVFFTTNQFSDFVGKCELSLETLIVQARSKFPTSNIHLYTPHLIFWAHRFSQYGILALHSCLAWTFSHLWSCRMATTRVSVFWISLSSSHCRGQRHLCNLSNLALSFSPNYFLSTDSFSYASGEFITIQH